MKKEYTWVTVGLYRNPLQAIIDCDMLKENGLHARVEDLNTIMNNPFYSSDFGAARLLVQENEMEKALEILAASKISRFN